MESKTVEWFDSSNYSQLESLTPREWGVLICARQAVFNLLEIGGESNFNSAKTLLNIIKKTPCDIDKFIDDRVVTSILSTTPVMHFINPDDWPYQPVDVLSGYDFAKISSYLNNLEPKGIVGDCIVNGGWHKQYDVPWFHESTGTLVRKIQNEVFEDDESQEQEAFISIDLSASKKQILNSVEEIIDSLKVSTGNKKTSIRHRTPKISFWLKSRVIEYTDIKLWCTLGDVQLSNEDYATLLFDPDLVGDELSSLRKTTLKHHNDIFSNNIGSLSRPLKDILHLM